MASKENPELDPTSAGTGDETIVEARKKRLRRVSFADVEITSVHIFKRDEDYSDSTPPSDPKPDDGTGRLTVGDGLGLFRDLGDHSDDSKELNCEREDEDDEEEMVGRGSFFRPVESPSPGSSTVGSAVSNDEDDFFGPVSASFIRPGRLSDSAASDENHDITMDSTAFSMHFRSLARSESGDLKTPTRVGLGFEQKTPTQDAAEETNQGSLMVLTNARKLAQESSIPLDNCRSGGKDSNEMSLVGENPHRYDYGRLSPSLDALLAAGNKDLQHASPSHLADLKSLSAFGSDRNSQKHLIDFGDEEIGWGTHDTNKAISAADSYSESMPIQQAMKDVSNRNDGSAIMPEYKSISTPEQLVKGNDLIEAEVEMDGPNIGFSFIIQGTPRSNVSQLLDLDAAALHQSAYGRSSEEYPKESCRRSGSQRVDKSDRMIESPLAGSISSISAKRREIFTYATTSPTKFSNLTPLPEQLASSRSKESEKRGLSLSSIQKSISKFRSLETSPTTSALKNGIEKLKLKILNHLSTNSPHNTACVESSIEVPSRGVHAPVSDLEHLNDHPKEADDKIMLIADSNGIPSPPDINEVGILGQNQEITVVVEPGEPHVELPKSISSNNDITKDVLEMISSPSIVSCSGPIPNNLWKIELPASEVGSSLVNVVVDHRKDDEDAHAPSELLISPVKGADQKPSPEKFYQRGTSAESDQQHQLNNPTGVNYEGNYTSRETVSSAGCSTPDTEKLVSFTSGMRAEDGENLEVSSHKELSRGNNRADVKGDGSSFVRDAPGTSASVLFQGREDKSPLKKSPLKEPAQSPGRTKSSGSPFLGELTNSPPADVVQSLPREEIASSPSKSNYIRLIDYQKDSYHSVRPLPVDDCEGSSSRKRRREEAVIGDIFRISKISRTKRSFEVEKSDSHDVACYREPSDEREEPGSDVPLSDWKDVLTKLSQDTEKMLCPLHDRLDLRGIIMLEETLINLQKVRNYDILTSEIQSQRFPAQLGNASHKRSAETLLLLQKLVYGKASLQLNLVRRDRLQKIAQNLSSGVEDSQNLRQMFKESVSLPVRGNQPDHDCKLKNKAAYDVVTSMTQERDVLDKKVWSLSNSLLAYCKTKGERSCGNDVASLEGSLKKRIFSRLVRQHLQPWEIADFRSINKQDNISLNYLGFICQSISVTTTYPVPKFTVSNKLQDQMIEKTFPNMVACEAFAYVFRGEAAAEIVSSRSLARKTQAMQFLLRNLLEVVEEVQQAGVEIKNLICTKFHSPSEGQLDLQLSFLDINTYQKVTMALGMTCLDRDLPFRSPSKSYNGLHERDAPIPCNRNYHCCEFSSIWIPENHEIVQVCLRIGTKLGVTEPPCQETEEGSQQATNSAAEATASGKLHMDTASDLLNSSSDQFTVASLLLSAVGPCER